ncbi:hypothetical protein BKG83_17305 [Mycobacteroides chelonae]|uniref:Uncharacterized protein n=1 Tax=Mycobacteroides chelonae TaxID=1774 RepID=A0A1S1M0C9_MYCCH|nr:hypothetical protein BKG83_17305 [Mycobacteroides chelonae]OHU76013.1 hypothetical protein BKG84_25135 [Mycobacteroides chelonae]
MRTQRPLNADEHSELEALNAAVQAAIDARREWLDAKMRETSKLQVGDDIYDVQTGEKIGVVSGLYRYHAGRDDLYDTYVECDYQYETRPGCFGNTSSQGGRMFGTREDAAAHAKSLVAQLEAAPHE